MFKHSSVKRTEISRVSLLVVVLLFIGVTAQASGILNSPSGGYLVCVDSKTKVVTHPGTTKCPKGDKKLLLGAQGATGEAGANGLTGATGLPGKNGTDGKDGKTLWNGVKDPESTWGAPGDMFINSATKTLFGPKNLDGTWPVGVSMIGPAGAPGASGTPGVSGTKISELSICGGSRTSLCLVGSQGPGGGLIFFVDYNDQYAGFNYLEAAPKSCAAKLPWSLFNVSDSALTNWGARAVGAGITNTGVFISHRTLGDDSSTAAAIYADELTCGGKSDWFLGSVGEMKLMYDNLQGLGDFDLLDSADNWTPQYWTSSASPLSSSTAFIQYFHTAGQEAPNKSDSYWVRPVRRFQTSLN